MTETALVTGASRGIGAGIALVLLRRGWNVAVAATDSARADAAAARICAEAGCARDRAIGVGLTVEEPAQWEAALDATEAAFGRLDGLVCNAGISPKRDNAKIPLAGEGCAEAWRQTFAVNVHGCVTGVRQFAARRLERELQGGSVVVISSLAALVGFPFVSSYYSASKAALLGFVRAAAHDLGAHGMRLNAVAPGRIETDMVRESPQGVNESIALQTALGRMGTPEELGEAVEFLLSQRASFITGTCLNVTGGWSEA